MPFATRLPPPATTRCRRASMRRRRRKPCCGRWPTSRGGEQRPRRRRSQRKWHERHTPMTDWIDDLAQLRERQEPAVIVTVASTKGSVPREAGTKMIVTPERVYGTIGGGHLELQAISIARDQIVARACSDDLLRRFPLGASLGQCCGGVVNLLFESAADNSPWLDDLLTLRRDRVPCIVVSPARASGDA